MNWKKDGKNRSKQKRESNHINSTTLESHMDMDMDTDTNTNTNTNMGVDWDLGLEPMEGLEGALNIRRMDQDGVEDKG